MKFAKNKRKLPGRTSRDVSHKLDSLGKKKYDNVNESLTILQNRNSEPSLAVIEAAETTNMNLPTGIEDLPTFITAQQSRSPERGKTAIIPKKIREKNTKVMNQNLDKFFKKNNIMIDVNGLMKKDKGVPSNTVGIPKSAQQIESLTTQDVPMTKLKKSQMGTSSMTNFFTSAYFIEGAPVQSAPITNTRKNLSGMLGNPSGRREVNEICKNEG